MSERVEVVDVLRGFALLGILFAHMIVWHTGGALPPFVYQQYSDTASMLTMAFFGTLIFGKFFSLFAFLFGLSFHIMREKKGAGFVSWFIKRLVVLGVIGVIHHALWRGDILLIYAILGFWLLLLGTARPRTLMIISLLLVLNVPNLIYDLLFVTQQENSVTLPMQEQAQRYYYLLADGTFLEIVRDNITIVASKFGFQFSSGRLLTTLGFFLLGAWFGCVNGISKFFGDPESIHKVFKWSGAACLAMLAIGLAFVLSGTLTLPGLHFDPHLAWLMTWLYNCFNGVLTIWYIAAMAKLYNGKSMRRIMAVLKYPGRMAMSVYIFQTFIGLVLYYPFGLGLFDELAPWANAVLVIPMFALQVYLCRLWLKYHRHGPLEIVWARLTDMPWIPLNRRRSFDVK